jgi:hypothetical protein
MYQKVGMFGMPAVPFFNPGDNAHQGDQVRGFGFLHDGSADTLFRFHRATVFDASPGNPGGFTNDAAGDQDRREMEAFMMEFPSNHAPIVGQQITRTSTPSVDVDNRVDLMLARSDAAPSECDVVAKGTSGGEPRGYVYVGGDTWESDRESDGTLTDAALRAQADTPGQELTFTAVPVGEGFRIGVDRDGDGYRDGDEIDGGSNPASAVSMLCDTTNGFGPKDKTSVKDVKGQANFKAAVVLGTYDRENVQLVIADSDGAFFDSGLEGDLLDVNNAGNTYKFKTKELGGITQVQIKVDKKVAGGFKVKVKTREAWTPGGADEAEATTFVTLNVGGKCFTGNVTSVK